MLFFGFKKTALLVDVLKFVSVLSPLDFIDRVKRGAVIWKECGGLESNRGARSESEMVGINSIAGSSREIYLLQSIWVLL